MRLKEGAIIAWGAIFWIVTFGCCCYNLFYKGRCIFIDTANHRAGKRECIKEAKRGETPITHDPIEWWGWLIFAIILLAFFYGEGIRSLHMQFCARTIKRTVEIARPSNASDENRRLVLISQIAAPLSGAGFFHATRKRLIISYVLVIGVVSVVIAISYLPWPWREFIDVSVSSAMLIGFLSCIFYTWKLCRGDLPKIESEFPPISPFVMPSKEGMSMGDDDTSAEDGVKDSNVEDGMKGNIENETKGSIPKSTASKSTELATPADDQMNLEVTAGEIQVTV